jgi:hypothetical protein
MSMKNSNDILGNRNRELPTCSAVPQPTAPQCTPSGLISFLKYYMIFLRNNFTPNYVLNQFILIAAHARFISKSNVNYGILNRRAAHQSSAVKYISPRLSICTFIILFAFYSWWPIERNNWTAIRLKFEKYLQSTYFWLRPVTKVKL